MEKVAVAIVLLAGLWLIGIGTAAFATPERAERFLGAFANSAFVHFFEVCLRIITGMAFVIYSSQMKFPGVFTVFGWMLILTSVVLLFVPWKLHKRFADRSLPLATKHISLFGFVSCSGGLFTIVSVILGSDPH